MLYTCTLACQPRTNILQNTMKVEILSFKIIYLFFIIVTVKANTFLQTCNNRNSEFSQIQDITVSLQWMKVSHLFNNEANIFLTYSRMACVILACFIGIYGLSRLATMHPSIFSRPLNRESLFQQLKNTAGCSCLKQEDITLNHVSILPLLDTPDEHINIQLFFFSPDSATKAEKLKYQHSLAVTQYRGAFFCRTHQIAEFSWRNMDFSISCRP